MHSSKPVRNIAVAGGGDPVMSVCGGGEEGEVHVYAKRGAEVTIHREKGRGGGGQPHSSKHRSKVCVHVTTSFVCTAELQLHLCPIDWLN